MAASGDDSGTVAERPPDRMISARSPACSSCGIGISTLYSMVTRDTRAANPVEGGRATGVWRTRRFCKSLVML